MKYLIAAFAFSTLPLFAQNPFGTGTPGTSIGADFEALLKQRQKARQEALAPIEKKFTENANQLLGKAIQSGDMATAERIKRELLAVTSQAKIEEIRKTLLFYSWVANRDLILNFEEDGNAAASIYSATFEVQPNGTVAMSWKSGEHTTLTPTPDFSALVEKGGGNNTFVRIPKRAKPATPLGK
ncbi:hypothetical protein [Luteolibacter sp. LG18]|uniref:hypothetical protein n=1 Tax=Luteolibacter sp. LG18 TaxID=2819286 RepID=UPI002B2AB4C8|nr:hypothetical protein llg_28510 [Luteolibacter sp. LG18]